MPMTRRPRIPDRLLSKAFWIALPSIALLSLSGCDATRGVRIAPAWDLGPPPDLAAVPKWEISTAGGAGGPTFAVTTLQATGPGSLEEALEAGGPRQVVFKVGGVIDLGAREWVIRSPHLTLDGSCAPEPGITLIRGGLVVATHDVVIRHLRIRPGEAGFAKGSGWEIDGITTVGGARNVIVEHCSISWATDENLSASGPRFEGDTPEDWRRNTSHRILFRHNIIAEGLSRSTHTEPEHSKGSLIHDNVTEIALIGNLYISNMQRNPLFKGDTRALFANNVIHNPGRWAIHYTLVPSEWQGRQPIPGRLAIAGNVIRFGPNTPREMPLGAFTGGCEVFLHDNRAINQATADLSLPWVGQFTRLPNPPFWLSGFDPLPSSSTTDWVLERAGARPWSRDTVDRRLVEEARTGGGRIKHSEREAEGYPQLPRLTTDGL